MALLALWSNLHGAALLGLGVLWAYLALSRFSQDRPTAIAAGPLAPAAMCLTPAGVHTVDYYEGLLTNVAAQRGVGLWAPLGSSALDVLLVVAALALAFRARCQRPAMWELVVLAVLALVTIRAARDGVWLLFMLVAPAAPGTRKTPGGAVCSPSAPPVAVALLAFDLARPSMGRVVRRCRGRSCSRAGRRSSPRRSPPSSWRSRAGRYGPGTRSTRSRIASRGVSRLARRCGQRPRGAFSLADPGGAREPWKRCRHADRHGRCFQARVRGLREM